jgi:hypothetical protein
MKGNNAPESSATCPNKAKMAAPIITPVPSEIAPVSDRLLFLYLPIIEIKIFS